MNTKSLSVIVILFASLVSLNGCQKTNEGSDIQLPVVSTTVGNIKRTSAICTALISFKDDNKSKINYVEFYFSENPNPTKEDSATYGDKINDSIYRSRDLYLKYNKTYYARACITLVNGSIIFGDDFTFTTANPAIQFNPNLTYGSVADIDGNVYKTIQIGNKTWMAENLKVTHFNNGDPIPEVADDVVWDNTPDAAFCYYENDKSNNEIYGKLYNGYAVVDNRKIAPMGWHIPTKYELQELMNYGIVHLNESGDSHWEYNRTAYNNTGFTAIPGGVRSGHWVYFCCMGSTFELWSRSEYNDPSMDSQLHKLFISYGCPSCESTSKVNTTFKNDGMSIRCVKD